MVPESSFAEELQLRLRELRELSTSAPDKYLGLEWWLSQQLRLEAEQVTTVYLSDLSRQFTARIGAALISEPLVLVVLGSTDFERANAQGISPLDRLARICAYVGRIQLVLVAEGEEGTDWTVRFVVGPYTSGLFAQAQDLLPQAEPIPVIVPPL